MRSCAAPSQGPQPPDDILFAHATHRRRTRKPRPSASRTRTARRTGSPTTPASPWSSTSTRKTTRRDAPRKRARFATTCPKFQTSKAVVLGVSGQGEASKAKFAGKYELTFPLLADEKYEVAEKYGVWQKKLLYGRTFMGVSRTTYLIGPDGKVVKRWDKVKVDGHAEAVLKAARSSLTASSRTAAVSVSRCRPATRIARS